LKKHNFAFYNKAKESTKEHTKLSQFSTIEADNEYTATAIGNIEIIKNNLIHPKGTPT
jgi:hypothetical protein